ncbi:MAG: hypothetical protein WB952_23660 [Terriglobales bacterium]
MKNTETVGVVAGRPRWRWVLVSVVMFSVVISLATRTFRFTVPHGVTAQSSAAQAVRQHMDRAVAFWTPPVHVFAPLESPTFYPYMAPAGPPMSALLLDKSLYNRPPPSC